MTDIERWRRRPGPRTRAWPLVCVALGVVCILAALVQVASSGGDGGVSQGVGGALRRLSGGRLSRRLSGDDEEKIHACENVDDLTSFDTNGGVVVWFLCIIYVFLGVAIICDDYFVVALEDIVRILKMREDVAGATFMAAGSSAPEFATVCITTLIRPGAAPPSLAALVPPPKRATPLTTPAPLAPPPLLARAHTLASGCSGLSGHVAQVTRASVTWSARRSSTR